MEKLYPNICCITNMKQYHEYEAVGKIGRSQKARTGDKSRCVLGGSCASLSPSYVSYLDKCYLFYIKDLKVPFLYFWPETSNIKFCLWSLTFIQFTLAHCPDWATGIFLHTDTHYFDRLQLDRNNLKVVNITDIHAILQGEQCEFLPSSVISRMCVVLGLWPNDDYFNEPWLFS